MAARSAMLFFMLNNLFRVHKLYLFSLAAFVIVFMLYWNNYLWPLIVLQSNETKTITLVVSSLASAYYPDYGTVMIGTILATLPTLLIFFAMQRQFVQGMLGSVK